MEKKPWQENLDNLVLVIIIAILALSTIVTVVTGKPLEATVTLLLIVTFGFIRRALKI